jgi:putative hydrolase of the HAD superfamily
LTVEAVLFDWGGTLSTYADVDLLSMWRAAAEVLAPEDAERLAERLLEAENAWWTQRVGFGDGTGSGTTEDLIRSVEERTHLPVEEALAAYHGAWEITIDHDPAALGVLKGLKERGVRTGLLSNTHWPRALHERWLDEAGLLEHLDVRLYTSDMEHMKPHPAAFTALLDAVGVTADRAVFVGDRLRDDILGAQGVGMRAVHLTGRHPLEPTDIVPDVEMASVAGLLDLVDRWS